MVPLIAVRLAAPDAAPAALAEAASAPEGVAAPPDGRDDGRADEGRTPFGDVLRGEERDAPTDPAPSVHGGRGRERKASHAADSDLTVGTSSQAAPGAPFYLLAHWLPAVAASMPRPAAPQGESSVPHAGDGSTPAAGTAAPAGDELPHGDASPAGRRSLAHTIAAAIDDLSVNPVNPANPAQSTAPTPRPGATGAPTASTVPAVGVDDVDTVDRPASAGLTGVPATDDAVSDVATGASTATARQVAPLPDMAHGSAPDPATALSMPGRDAPGRNQAMPTAGQTSGVHADASALPGVPATTIASDGSKGQTSAAPILQPTGPARPADDSPRSAADNERRRPSTSTSVPVPASSASVPMPGPAARVPVPGPVAGLAAKVGERAPTVGRDGRRVVDGTALPLTRGGATESSATDAGQGQEAAPARRLIGQARVAPGTVTHISMIGAVSTDAGASPAVGKAQGQAVSGDAGTRHVSAFPTAQVARFADALPFVAARPGEPRAVSQPDTKRSTREDTVESAREKGDAKVEQAPDWRFGAWSLASDGRNASAASASSRDTPAGQDGPRHESRDASGDTPVLASLPATTPTSETRHKDGGAGVVASQLGNIAATVVQDVRMMRTDVRTGAALQAAPVTKAADKGGLAPEHAVTRREVGEAGDTAAEAPVRRDGDVAFALPQALTAANNGTVTGATERAPASTHHAEQLPPPLAPVVEGIVVRQASLHRGATGSSFNVVLQPEALGTVRIRVENGHDGLRVTLAPQQQEAHGLLAHHLDDLVATLQRSGADGASRVHVDVLAPGGHIEADTAAVAATSAAHEAGRHANNGGHEGNQGYEGGQGQSQSQDLAGNMGSMDGGQRQSAYRDDAPAWTPADTRPAAANSYGWSAPRGAGAGDTAVSRRAPHAARIDVQA